MHILGINSAYHESSACLISDGVIVASAEEERFNHIRHGKQALAGNPDEFPLRSIEFCLKAGGLRPGMVDHIAYAADLHTIENVCRSGLPSAWNSRGKQERFIAKLAGIPAKLANLGFPGVFHWVGHHAAHAASAFLASPFAEAAILVADALGDDAFSARLYHGHQDTLDCIHSVSYPCSLGYLWELISIFLGFGVYDAAKVMGLAAYGDPQRFSDAMDQLIWLEADGNFGMAHDLLRFSDILYYPPSADCGGIEKLFGISQRAAGAPLLDQHQDVAAALQAKTNIVAAHIAQHLYDRTGSKNLCLAGGLALNCVTNEHIFRNGPFEKLFVQPAAHDGGLALGAALYVLNAVLGCPRTEPMLHAYWGPRFTEAEIEDELRRHQLSYRRVQDFEREVARLLSEENVVGFFQGAMELGPRALGNRSILADPRKREMRDVLNRKVKHREYFRPLAPSVLHEEASAWFHIGKETSASDFMLMAYPAREERKKDIQAVLHVDGTCRLQTVRREMNPSFHRVIAAFRDITQVPMVLNTSFNDQEPIICTPADAVNTFQKTAIDYLAIGPFIVRKNASESAR